MNYLTRPWRRPVLRVLLLALAVAAAPLPAFAADPPAPRANLNLKVSVQKAVAQEIGTVKHSGVARSQQSSGGGTTTDLGSPSFFKTPAGIVTIVATAVGVGLALRSTSKDRIKVEQITR